MIDLWVFRLSLMMLATGLGIGLSMIFNSSFGFYISGAIIGCTGGFVTGYLYGKFRKTTIGTK